MIIRGTCQPAIAGFLIALLLAGLGVESANVAQAAQSTSDDRIEPVPDLPPIGTIPSRTGKATTAFRSTPAEASPKSGKWVTWAGLDSQPATTVVTMATASGIPLLADWNGDGVATPGRFDAGRWFYTDGAVNRQQWQPLATLGSSGSIPVVGDRDGDGKADIGVFSNGAWQWRLATGAPGPTESLGAPGDLPVVGDWDADGRDDIGVFRGGTWVLRVENVRKGKVPWAGKAVTVTGLPQAQAVTLTFTFGAAGDVPIAGDWDADGRSTPGVVRAGAQWILARNFIRLGKTTTLTYPVNAGYSPLVGSQPAAVGRCPTATSAALDSASGLFQGVQPPVKIKGTFAIDGMREIKDTVEDGLRFVMTNDLTKRLKERTVMPYYDPLDTHPTDEESLRRSANSAQAAAIMATTTKWRDVNGISRDTLVRYARWHIRSIACEHLSVTPGGWGHSFQSALWATVAGQAGWMLWDELEEPERAYVAAMVASEADYVAARGPFYFRNRAGVEITPGDSRSDEVSWSLMAPALALSMMPDDRRAPAWRASLVSLAIAAFARPSDLKSKDVFNGVRIGKELPGTNANEDGTVTNHGIVNPDYTQNVQHLWWAASMLRSGRQQVPASLFLNADIVYRALAVVNFPSPPYAAPGGVVYQPLGVIYYPMGISWGVRRPATFTGVDSFANAYAAPDVRAADFLAAHARDARALQLRFQDGHMYLPGKAEESYKLGKEEYALQQMALAWWAGAVRVGPSMTVTNDPVPGVTLEPVVPIAQ